MYVISAIKKKKTSAEPKMFAKPVIIREPTLENNFIAESYNGDGVENLTSNFEHQETQ